MSQAEQERSQEQREASETESEAEAEQHCVRPARLLHHRRADTLAAKQFHAGDRRLPGQYHPPELQHGCLRAARIDVARRLGDLLLGYVGVFIPRISRGRTIREFILRVIIAPTIYSMIWFSEFESASIQADNQTNGAISSAAGTSEALGLFAYLEQNPLFLLTSISVISTSSGDTPGSETRMMRSLPLVTTSVEGTQAVAWVLGRASCPLSGPILPDPNSRIRFHSLIESTSP
jgi:hypothetical protein